MDEPITAETLRKSTIDWARWMILEEKVEVQACTFATNGEDIYILPASGLFGEEDGKDIYLTLVREAVKAMGLTGTCFVTEAWMARGEGDPPYDLRPSEREDRIEVLVISTETEGSLQVETWEIKEGRTDLVKVDEMDRGTLEMRFTFFGANIRPQAKHIDA